ncbi:transposable element Tcb2 transposase [Trichonephila clavipes]|nr:transposable element Tcb2 transposase [Trichonephila clavipes]
MDDLKIWREDGKALAPKTTIKPVKFGEGSVLVWGCISAGGVGKLYFIHGIVEKHAYLGELKDNLEKSASKWGLGQASYSSRTTTPSIQRELCSYTCFQHCRKQLHILAQFLNLNVIENLWSQLEKLYMSTKSQARNF